MTLSPNVHHLLLWIRHYWALVVDYIAQFDVVRAGIVEEPGGAVVENLNLIVSNDLKLQIAKALALSLIVAGVVVAYRSGYRPVAQAIWMFETSEMVHVRLPEYQLEPFAQFAENHQLVGVGVFHYAV